MAGAISKNQVSDPGPSWPSCYQYSAQYFFPATGCFLAIESLVLINLKKEPVENIVGKKRKCFSPSMISTLSKINQTFE